MKSKIHRYWAGLTATEKRELLNRCDGNSYVYLCQIFGGHRTPSPRFAKSLAEATGGALTPSDFLPELFDAA